MATIPVCTGSLSTDVNGAILCDSSWTWIDQATIPIPFDYSQVDPLILSEMFTGGFVLVGSIWLAGRVIGHILSMIRSS